MITPFRAAALLLLPCLCTPPVTGCERQDVQDRGQLTQLRQQDPPQEDKSQEQKKSPEELLRERLLEEIDTRAAQEVRRVLAAELLAELDEIHQMFQLDEADLRKLRLAARGAASKSVDQNRDRNRATVERMVKRRFDDPTIDLNRVTFNGEKLDVDGAQDDAAEAGEDKANPLPQNTLGITISRRSTGFYFTVRYQNGSSSTSIGPRNDEVKSQEIWTRAADGILTKEQLSEYAEMRARKLKEAIVTMVMAGLIYELRLSDKQVPDVRATVEKVLKISSTSMSAGVESALRTYRMQLLPADFKAVLTPAQLDLFRSTQAYYRRYLR